MKEFLVWLVDQFDKTDVVLVIGLTLLYHGLSQDPSIPVWVPLTVVGGVFVSIACLGYWRG